MSNWQFAALALLILIYGGMVLDRLPKAKKHNGHSSEPSHEEYIWESPDDYVTFGIETLLEDEFNVAFVDGWNVGRDFALYGAVIPRDDLWKAPLPEFGKRTGVRISAMPAWFQSSRIGGVETYDHGGSECFVELPYQIARHILEDIRNDPHQHVTLGFKRVTGNDGRNTYPIHSFKLTKALD